MVTADLGPCQSGYCDRPAVAFVTRTVGSSPRFLVILGRRAERLAGGIEGMGSPLALRCLDCAHDGLDQAVTTGPACGTRCSTSGLP